MFNAHHREFISRHSLWLIAADYYGIHDKIDEPRKAPAKRVLHFSFPLPLPLKGFVIAYHALFTGFSSLG
jgi:hypothetical protein